ncbi:hypothetical protein LX32DRAFT_636871 [Colletotrichum zoysiae]|uniref:Uncharacterized protein n=1 Tax=Colletotrichum zoysiae TaxID=1216348 RepID=A0AAD9HMH8_9PEZI|nr:hypothetical protein LX32DRAFT_636871 [Colletotrichum zoysiae]
MQVIHKDLDSAAQGTGTQPTVDNPGQASSQQPASDIQGRDGPMGHAYPVPRSHMRRDMPQQQQKQEIVAEDSPMQASFRPPAPGQAGFDFPPPHTLGPMGPDAYSQPAFGQAGFGFPPPYTLGPMGPGAYSQPAFGQAGFGFPPPYTLGPMGPGAYSQPAFGQAGFGFPPTFTPSGPKSPGVYSQPGFGYPPTITVSGPMGPAVYRFEGIASPTGPGASPAAHKKTEREGPSRRDTHAAPRPASASKPTGRSRGKTHQVVGKLGEYEFKKPVSAGKRSNSLPRIDDAWHEAWSGEPWYESWSEY